LISSASAGLCFADRVIAWQRQSGRHDLPWQQTRDPYRIWVSEIMLQQTQVATVLGYYPRFLARFPDVAALAAADPDAVLGAWSGLGYYSRARNLHACARSVMRDHGGRFPTDAAVLETLPGIGPSTAAAIAVFSSGAQAAILDGNVKRVLCRAFGIEGFPGERAVEQQLWVLARRELPQAVPGHIEAYTQGLMDLGATLCTRTRSRCEVCPVGPGCVARASSRQAQLPTPRATRVLEWRFVDWVLVHTEGAVLLHRRPAHGLWGGLWSLPEAASPALQADASSTQDAAGEFGVPPSVDAFASRVLGLADAVVRPAGEVRHVFTHFRLRARVWRMEPALDHPVEVPDHLWLALDDLQDAPLPRPVRGVLESLARSSG
jgi:A/G-specific adenine glycosylase